MELGRLLTVVVFHRLLREALVYVTATLFEDGARVHVLLELLELLARGQVHFAAVGRRRLLVAVHCGFYLPGGLGELLVYH